MIKKLIILAILIVALGSVTSAVSAADDVVSTDTNTDIQLKIDQAGAGDTINFDNSTYENIKLTLNKSITLNGNGATLKGTGVSNNMFTISGNASSGVYQNIVITNFIFETLGSTGIRVTAGTNFTFTDITMIGNGANGTGIDVRSGCNGLNIDNVNISKFYDAIGVGGGNNTVITNCNISDNVRNGMSFFQNAGNIKVQDNYLNNASYGIFFGGGVSDIIISGNTITDMNAIGLALVKSAETATIVSNNIIGNEIGIVIKGNDTNHGAPTFVNAILIDNNNITGNGLFGILLENLPESIIGTGKLNITNTNNITNNGLRYKEYYNLVPGSQWNNEIGDSFNIIKNFYQDPAYETNNTVIIEVPVEKIVTVEKIVEKKVSKDVVILPAVKASKTKVKKGKKIAVYVKLKNIGKDKSNTLKIYNKYTKKTLKAIINGKKSKTLKFTVKIIKKGINKIPIYLNGRLIAVVKVRGV